MRRVCFAFALLVSAGEAHAQNAASTTANPSSTPSAPAAASSLEDAGPDFNAVHDAFGVSEVRFGIFGQIADGNEREDGAYGEIEALFTRPSWVFENPILDLFLRPRPHLGGIVNTAGGTSQAFAGLTWDVWLSERFFLEGSLGLSLHNGELDLAGLDEGPALGCRVLLREGAAAGVAVTPNWRVVASLDHASNGGRCSEDDGITHAGVAFGYSF